MVLNIRIKFFWYTNFYIYIKLIKIQDFVIKVLIKEGVKVIVNYLQVYCMSTKPKKI